MCKLLNMYKFAHTRPSPRLSLSLYQSQCPHIALINSQLQNNFTNLGLLKLQSKWFKCYREDLITQGWDTESSSQYSL